MDEIKESKGKGLIIKIEEIIDFVINWGRRNSLWYLLFGTACCAIEGLMHTGGPRYDFDRFGAFFRSTPRQADLMIVAGTITLKMAERVRLLWEQMAEPKWVMAVGSCAISGGPFVKDSYSVLRGIDKVIPVDVYVPGCPPRPEMVLEGFMKIQKKIKEQKGNLRLASRRPKPKGAGDLVWKPE